MEVPVFGGLTAQVDWLGLWLADTRRSVYIHQMNRVNSRHNDGTVNIVVVIIIKITLLLLRKKTLKPP